MVLVNLWQSLCGSWRWVRCGKKCGKLEAGGTTREMGLFLFATNQASSLTTAWMLQPWLIMVLVNLWLSLWWSWRWARCGEFGGSWKWVRWRYQIVNLFSSYVFIFFHSSFSNASIHSSSRKCMCRMLGDGDYHWTWLEGELIVFLFATFYIPLFI